MIGNSGTPAAPGNTTPVPNPLNTNLRLYPANYEGYHRTDYRVEAGTPEVALTQSDYERFRAFIRQRTGLDFNEDKRRLLSWGLAKLLQVTACGSLDRLYAQLWQSSTTGALWDVLIGVLTVGETYFFRHTPHFDALARHILPAIMAQHAAGNRRLRIWSAGCASGEEPYSIAIVLKELVPYLDSWDVFILATDINREALHKARQGVYSGWSFRGVEKPIRDKYFQAQGNQFALADEIKRMVTFEYLNLIADPYPSLATNTNAMDLILCRNVTIYFSAEITQAVVRGLSRCLTDEGWLIPGPSEPNLVHYSDFDPRNFPGAVVYQKHKPPPNGKLFTPATTAAYVSKARAVAARVELPRPKPAAFARPSVTPPPDAYQTALELLQAGEVEQAFAKLSEKLAQNADFAPAHSTLGRIYANQGNLSEAARWCERAIELDKLQPEPYYTLSMIYQEQGKLDAAAEALRKAIYLNREFVLAHYNLAQIHIRQRQKELARKTLQNVQRLLAGKPKDELVPEGDGLLVGRLLELVDAYLEQDA
jgi:chemotaxis protein methyltransferase CheR